ncbi:hypothetical protein [Paenibacillus sp. IHBB 3054]|uniref:hypothetical protein n=1 Tax=Paenibacillus sp. IHBB 3054 TaxID=3425689 RepID=UPI003F669D2B
MTYVANADQLMGALLAKLYQTITGEGADLKQPSNKYVSWILPGIPMVPEDFTYCEKGLNGATAEERRLLAHQAFVMSKLLDYIPDPSGLALEPEMQQTIFTTTQDTISSVYNDVLKYSRVVHFELSEEEKQKIAGYRAFETEKITVYLQYFDAYAKAASELTIAFIAAKSATGNSPEELAKVEYWSKMGKILRQREHIAYDQWNSLGFKNEIEDKQKYIEAVGLKSMVTYKGELLELLRDHTEDGFDEGLFLYTSLIPGNFAKSEGWLHFEFGESDFQTYSGKSVTKGSLGGGVKLLGVFKIGSASGSTTTTTITESDKATNFKVTFEFAQIPILRPWFKPGFFSMRGWDLDKMWDLNLPDKKVSDGESVGRLVAYPISALFVRNVVLSFDETSNYSNTFNNASSGGGSVGWGPFRLKGSFNTPRDVKTTGHHEENGKITIEGLQLIGFINNMIPKSPNLHPDINPEDLAGSDEGNPS